MLTYFVIMQQDLGKPYDVIFTSYEEAVDEIQKIGSLMEKFTIHKVYVAT